ncbi:MAG: bifunctional nuclease family protein [Bacteroidota bacterium]
MSGSKLRYYLTLKGKDDPGKSLVMGIGEFEGQSIAIVIEKMTPTRPLPHDLFKTATLKFGFELHSILINQLDAEGYFSSLIKYSDGQKVVEVAARPADAIALALRHESPIYVARNVYEQYSAI